MNNDKNNGRLRMDQHDKDYYSPAKKMKIDTDSMACQHMTHFMTESEQLLSLLQKLTYDELKALWNCNDSIAELNVERIQSMNLENNLTPAIYAYEGIQ